MLSPQSHDPNITIIQPATGWQLPNLREVWEYRHVVGNMVMRNFKAGYRQTIVGPLYAIYGPFMSMIGYTFLLGGLADMPSEGIPYPVFTFSALTVWNLFTGALSGVSTSLAGNSGLLTKIYVPHLVFPLVAVAQAMLDYVIALAVLLAMMVVFGVAFSLNLLLLPVFVALALAHALGIGLLFAGLHARFRDTRYAVSTITRGLFFLTPVVYSSRVLPAPWDTLYAYNPLAVVIEGARWSLTGVNSAPQPGLVAMSAGIALVLIVVGALYFKQLEDTIADVV